MTILVIGGGGREHAILRKLRESPRAGKLYCAPGNGGIAADAECVDIRATDLPAMTDFAVRHGVEFAVVAPDDPLALGMVDALEAAGIPCFGPTKAAAAIESSKVFAKELMRNHGIPTADYRTFDDAKAAVDFIREKNVYPTVIKADGLALGKGVLLAEDFAAARAGVCSILEDKIFGDSGNRIVVEEFLTGPEVSVLAFTDGKTLAPMVSSMDHKRALDGDRGLNTGGMGTIAPNPFYTPAIAEECSRTIFLPTVEAMNAEGRPFRGVLYFGLMLTPRGPKVIEYNCRFGDPEAQVVLPLLESDLLEIFLACREGRLAETPVRFRPGAAACVMLASGGYPQSYQSGKEIAGLDSGGQSPLTTIYHSGTRREQGRYFTAGGRVLGVTATGETLMRALGRAYAAVETISFDAMQYRKDIGDRAIHSI